MSSRVVLLCRHSCRIGLGYCWRRLLLLVLLLFLGVGAALVGLAFVVSQPAGFSWAMQRLPLLSQGALSVGGSSGSLARAGALTDLRFDFGSGYLRIDRLAWSWQPEAMWQGRFVVDRIRLGEVFWESHSTNQPFEALVPPRNLGLPLAVAVDQITIDRLYLLPSKRTFTHINVAYRYEPTSAGVWHHAVELKRLASPFGDGVAEVSLVDQSPFRMAGNLTLTGVYEKKPWQATAKLSGDLFSLGIDGGLTGLADGSLHGQVNVFASTPFAQLKSLDLRLLNLNPRAHGLSKNSANLNLAAIVVPTEQGYKGGISVVNTESGRLDQNRWPIRLWSGQLDLSERRFALTESQLVLLQGDATMNLTSDGNSLDGQLLIHKLGLGQWGATASLPTDLVSGKITANGSLAEPRIAWRLAAASDLRVNGELQRENGKNKRWLLSQLQLAQGEQLMLSAQGSYSGTQEGSWQLVGTTQKLNPALWRSNWPSGSVSARFAFDGKLWPSKGGKADALASQNLASKNPSTSTLTPPSLYLTARLELMPGTLSGYPLQGYARFAVDGSRIHGVDVQLLVAGNRLSAEGNWDWQNRLPGHRLTMLIDAQALNRLGSDFDGRLTARAALQSGARATEWSVNLDGADLRLPGHLEAKKISLHGAWAGEAETPFQLQLQLDRASYQDWRSESIHLQSDGVLAHHRLSAQGTVFWRKEAYRLVAQAEGGLNLAESWQWQGRLRQLEWQAHGPAQPSFKLMAPTELTVSERLLATHALSAQVLGGKLRVDDLVWRYGGGNAWELRSNGQIERLPLDVLPQTAQPYWQQHLTLSGHWQVERQALTGLRGRVSLNRHDGDVRLKSLDGVYIPLQIHKLEASAELVGDRAFVDLVLDSPAAKLAGQAKLPVDGNGALDGQWTLQLDRLGLVSLLLGHSYDFDGQANAVIHLGGRWDEPTLSADIVGKGLRYRDPFSGVQLADGVLKGQLSESRITLDYLRFVNPKGVAADYADGNAVLRGSYEVKKEALELDLRFDRYQWINRPRSQLIASGEAKLSGDNKRLQLNGKIRSDFATFALQDAGAPSLSSDVEIYRASKSAAEVTANSSHTPFHMAIEADLGEKLQLSGKGLSAQLAGRLLLLSEPTRPFAIHGQIDIRQGRYRAYGQDLEVERGRLTFVGPYDNPVVSLLAKRRLSPVGAGVDVSGSLAEPTVRLVADEAMNETDLFSWLVLGRASTGSASDAQHLSAAAGTLLAADLNSRIALFDDVGLNERKARYLADGALSPAEQVIVLGKQVTKDLYLGYEYGLNTTKQAAKLVYRFNRFWSGVLTAGQISSQVESRWSWRFD